MRRSRAGALTGLALTLGLVVSGCGGDDDASSPAEGPASSATSPAPSETDTVDPSDPEPTDAEPTEAETPEPGSGYAEDYLPTPDGVTLTEPGARLGLKDPATAAWLPRQDLVGVVDVAVTRIEETTVQASLAGFDLGRDEQRSTPYFVTAKVTNVGETDLGARQLPLYFLDDRGMLVVPTGVARDFEACPGSTLPAVFAPGDSTRSCLIFLAPEGSALQSITFRPPEGVVPLRWTGEVRSLDERGSRQAPRRAE